MNKRHKLFLLSALSGAMIMGTIIVGNQLDGFGLNLSKTVAISNLEVNFSGNSKSIGNGRYSTKGTTSRGSVYYLIVDAGSSGCTPSSSRVLGFPGSASSKDTLFYISEFENGKDLNKNDCAFPFQNLNSISFDGFNNSFTATLTKYSVLNGGTTFSPTESTYALKKTGPNSIELGNDKFLYFSGKSTNFSEVMVNSVTVNFDCIPNSEASTVHNVSVAPGISNGNISLKNGSAFISGEKVSFSVVANSGYEVDSIFTNPSILIEQENDYYIFEMPNSDVEINATFKVSESPQSQDDIYSVLSKTSISGGYTNGISITAEFSFNADKTGTQVVKNGTFLSYKYSFKYTLDLSSENVYSLILSEIVKPASTNYCGVTNYKDGTITFNSQLSDVVSCKFHFNSTMVSDGDFYFNWSK